MKKNIFILILITLLSTLITRAQDTTLNNLEQQLENLTDADQAETEDDSFLQQLEGFRKNRLNLNTADENDLRELRILTGLQIANLITYKKLLGNLISIYELQAIPGWDIITIRKLLPFISVSDALSIKEEFAKRFNGGEHVLLFRVSQVIEKSDGFNKSTSGTKYLGSPQKIFFRYRYQ